jgi:hypothetical protein
MSCYTTTVIDPRGEDRAKMYIKDITMVLTKDGKTHVFDRPKPTIVNDSLIVGVHEGKSVVIPLSEVSVVYVEEADSGATVLALLGVTLLAVAIGVVIFTAIFVDAVD